MQFGPAGIDWKLLVIMLFAVVAVIPCVFFHRRKFLGTTWGPLLCLGTIAATLLLAYFYYRDMEGTFRAVLLQGHVSEFERFLSVFCHGAIVMFVVPFAVRLFNKWTGANLTEAERLPSRQGIRAWAGVGNVCLAVLIAFCAWQGYGYSFWAVLALTAGLVLAYPVINMLSKGTPAEVPEAAGDLSAERQRVLKLLEDGKITAEESAELLSALGQTIARPAGPAASMTGPQKLMLIGGLAVLIGFFLPWFSVNLGEELDCVMRQVQNTPSNSAVPMPPGVSFNGSTFGGPTGVMMPDASKLKTSTIRVSGGDVGNHLGWAILLLSLGAAGGTFVSSVQFSSRRVIALAATGLAGIIIVYLVVDGARWVSAGICVTLCGCVIEAIGAIRLRPMPQ